MDYQEIEIVVDKLEHRIWAGPSIEYPQQCYLNKNRAEPSTNGLKGHCSAIELRAPVADPEGDKADCILSCAIMSVNVIHAKHAASKGSAEAQ